MTDTNRTSNGVSKLPQLLREAERRVNEHVWGDRRAIVSIPADVSQDVDILLLTAADQIEAMASVGVRQEREIERLRAALEHYGRHAHPNCYDLTLKEDGSFGSRNGCLCGFDAAKGEGAPAETKAPHATIAQAMALIHEADHHLARQGFIADDLVRDKLQQASSVLAAEPKSNSYKKGFEDGFEAGQVTRLVQSPVEPTTNQDSRQTPVPSGHAGLGTTGRALSHGQSPEEPSEQLPTETGLRPGELAQLRRIDAAARFYVDSVKPGSGVAWENLMNALFDGRPEETKREHLHWCAIRIGKHCNCHSEGIEQRLSEKASAPRCVCARGKDFHPWRHCLTYTPENGPGEQT